MRAVKELLTRTGGKLEKKNKENILKIAYHEFQRTASMEASTYLMTFSDEMYRILFPFSGEMKYHHLGLYIGEYELEEEFQEELSFYLNLAENKIIDDLEYGKSEIAMDKYDTDGWWISFNWNEIHLEFFLYKASGSWGRFKVEEKVNRVSHVAYQIPTISMFRDIHKEVEGKDELEIIRSIEGDEVGHTYMHILDKETSRIIEIIFDPNTAMPLKKQSGRKNVAVIGVGKMGNCVASNISEEYQLLLYDLHVNKNMFNLMINRDAEIIHRDEELRKVHFITICVPADECERFLKEKKDVIGKNAVIICFSTGIRKDKVLELVGDNTVLFVKIIAEAGEIIKGNKPVLILQNSKDKKLQDEVSILLGDFGEVISDSADIYNNVNYISATCVIEAIFKVRDILNEANLPESVILKAITNVMAGTCSTYPWNANDVFINKVLEKMNK